MTTLAADRWSISLGSCWGFAARAHLSLLLAIVLIVAFFAHNAPTGGAILLGVLLASAVLHEAAHQAISARLMGQRDPVVLTPIGGLRLPSVPNDPEVQLLVGMVGPLVNLAIVVLSAGALAYSTESLAGVFTLTGPEKLLEGPWYEIVLKSALWVNWLTFLVSLIPAFPFDGGPALRAALWPLFGQRTAAVFSAQLARLIGFSLAVAAAFVLNAASSQALTLAAPLAALAMLVICSAQHELTQAFSTGGVALSGLLENAVVPVGARRGTSDQGGMLLEDASREGWLSHGLDPHGDEQDEDAVVDAILARLHTHGPQDLSEEDRRVLQRASRRYRDRHRGRTSSD